MKKTQKRFSLLVTLVCAFVLVLSLGIVSACGTGESASADGAWYFGAELPASELGQDGDYYLDTETLTSYVKEGKAWRAADPGEGGKWYYGTDALDGTETFGNTHDFYLDTDDGELYQKGADGWKSILVLKGKDGRDGVLWFSGKGVPENIKDSLVGDFYLNTEDFTVYQLTEEEGWKLLGTIKGDDGKDAKDPVQFFNSKGAPKDNETLLKDAKEGDLYLGKFDGWEEGSTGAGFRLYRKINGDWVVLIERIEENVLEIYSYADLVKFRDSVEKNDFKGKEVHLKTNIDFAGAEGASLRRGVNLIDGAEDWTPIGTETHPFRGTFDGEGHIISNFSAKTTDSVTAVGFFGYVDGATIEHLHFVGATVSASGEGSVGAVVMGHATGAITVRDVTVETSTVTATDGNATTGSLVGKSEGTVTVEGVEVEVNGAEEHVSGNEGLDLVGDGDVNFTGENVVEYPIADGFVEKHYKNGEETTVICEISSLDGFKAFRDSVNGTGKFAGKADTYAGKTVKLMTEEINLIGENWEPIGGYKIGEYPYTITTSFAGNFDGNHNKISNLTVNVSDGNDRTSVTNSGLGLFGYIWNKDSAVTIENLTLENVTIQPDFYSGNPYNSNVGAFVGYGNANGLTLRNLSLEGVISIQGNTEIGGIAGSLSGKAGGLSISDVSIDAKGTVTARTRAGGIVGMITDSAGYATTMTGVAVSGITLCSESCNIGGVVGFAGRSFTLNGATLDVTLVPYNNKSLTNPNSDKATNVGAVVGEWSSLNNQSSISNVKGEVTVKGPEGNENPRQAYFYNGGITGTDSYDALGNMTITDCTELTVNWYGLSYSLANKTWTVSNVSELKTFASLVNGGMTFEGETVVLTGDIDLSSVENWTPIGTNAHPFKGAFTGGTVTDGEIVPAVRKIENMTIAKTGNEEGLTEADDKKFAAFFAFTQNAAIANLHFVKANVTNSYTESDGAAGYCAVLVGRTNGGKLEISNVTIGEKFENTEAGKLAHAKEAPYVTSGKAVAAFVSRSEGDGSITLDNCINYANLCAPKAAGFIAQFHSNANTPLTITNSANYGNITMPQTKLCDSPDVVMGGFVGYNQNANSIVLINCENNGDITASCDYYVGKANVGGLISSVRGSTGSMLVDCINRGNITVDIQDASVTCNFEIGGLTGSGGATMYHVEQFGDITVSTVCNAKIYVGGVSGNEDKGNLHMKNRSEYTQVPAPEKGSRVERYDSDEYAGTKPKLEEHSNIVYCDITVTCPDATKALVGGATGNGHVNDTIDSTYVSIYAFVNGENMHNKTFNDSLVLGGMTGAAEYAITNSVLRIAAIQSRGMECAVYWDAEGN